MRRGEIRIVYLDPTRGVEAGKRRPAVIVSNDGANITAARLGRGVVTVVPATSNVTRLYPFQVLLEATDTGLDRLEGSGRTGSFHRRRTSWSPYRYRVPSAHGQA
jgi:mRNA interferase MazF